MTAFELHEKLNLEVGNLGNAKERIIEGIYCGDLLSIVMGRAKYNDVWITVMCNINTIAVSSLADTSCIILSEGMRLDEDAINKAREEDIAVFYSDLPTFELSQQIAKLLGL